MKTCPKCGETQPISNFYRNAKRHDGLAGWCIPCENRAGKGSAEKLRSQAITRLGGACIRCGYDTPGPALQIDHVNGDGAIERKANPSPRAILQAVLSDEHGRYQLLCANCNQIKRMEDAEHGERRRHPPKEEGGRSKFCPRCATTRPTHDFHANKARADGLSVYCGACMVARGREDMQRVRAEVVQHLGGRCRNCGYDTDRRALQIDHVHGDGSVERATLRNAALLRAVLADTEGRYQLLCANCNVTKKVTMREFRPRSTYTHKPATERRATRRYLDPAQIAELARLVAVEGMKQADVARQFGITQPVVSIHVRNVYPEYRGRANWNYREPRQP